MSPIKRRQLLKATLSASALVISNANYGFSKTSETTDNLDVDAATMFTTSSPPITITFSPPITTSSPPMTTLSPPTTTSSPPPGPDFIQERLTNGQIQLTSPSIAASVNILPGGATTEASKAYEIAFVFQNTSPAAAPAVLASLTLPSGLNFVSAKWEKEGAWYSDGNLPRTGSFDGKTVTCGIGELWSGMKATIKLRVTAEPGQYSLGAKVEDLSALYEIETVSRTTIPLTLT